MRKKFKFLLNGVFFEGEMGMGMGCLRFFFFEREMMKSAERVGTTRANVPRRGPDHIQITCRGGGHLSRPKSLECCPKARAVAHAMRTLHPCNPATIADFRTTSGSHLALASARALRKLLVSVDHLPPTSQPSTANLARPKPPASSGYVLFALSCLQQRPSRRIGENIVVSMTNCAPLQRERPSTTTSKRWLSTCLSGRRSISCTLTFTVTRPPASRQTLAATEQAAQWWPRDKWTATSAGR